MGVFSKYPKSNALVKAFSLVWKWLAWKLLETTDSPCPLVNALHKWGIFSLADVMNPGLNSQWGHKKNTTYLGIHSLIKNTVLLSLGTQIGWRRMM